MNQDDGWWRLKREVDAVPWAAAGRSYTPRTREADIRTTFSIRIGRLSAEASMCPYAARDCVLHNSHSCQPQSDDVPRRPRRRPLCSNRTIRELSVCRKTRPRVSMACSASQWLNHEERLRWHCKRGQNVEILLRLLMRDPELIGKIARGR